MKSSPIPMRVSSLATVVLLAAAVLLPGCVTQEQVSAIVAKSNAAMLAGSVGGLPDPTGKDGVAPWEQPNAQIEALCEAHQEQTDIVAPLRIRQAMLLLSHRQFNLATLAFEKAELDHLHTDRDQALKRLAPHLIFWCEHADAKGWGDGEQTRAKEAVAALSEALPGLAGNPEMKDYVAYTRAAIRVTAGWHLGDRVQSDGALKNALDEYAGTFSDADKELLRAAKAPEWRAPGLSADVKRCLRAKGLLTDLQQRLKRENRTIDVTDPVFKAYLTDEVSAIAGGGS